MIRKKKPQSSYTKLGIRKTIKELPKRRKNYGPRGLLKDSNATHKVNTKIMDLGYNHNHTSNHNIK